MFYYALLSFFIVWYYSGMSIAEIKLKLTPVLLKYGVLRAAVFGSVARGEDRSDSDVDLLVKVGSLPFGIWGFVGLKQDLEKALGKKVDVISEGALNSKLAKNIQRDLTQIYGQ
jgi:predicted nucleotidyltransferase